MIPNSCSYIIDDLEIVLKEYRLLIKIQIIRDQTVKLNLNRYTLDYLSLKIEAQEVGFKSSIYTKNSHFKI